MSEDSLERKNEGKRDRWREVVRGRRVRESLGRQAVKETKQMWRRQRIEKEMVGRMEVTSRGVMKAEGK